MGDLLGLVHFSIVLRIQSNDSTISYKVDGQCFGQNCAIKLLTGSSYKVEVKIKPTTVKDENISIGGVLFPLELKSKEPDGDRIVYMDTYNTEGVAPTKSGEWQPIRVTMPFIDIGTFEWCVKSSSTVTTSKITASGAVPSPYEYKSMRHTVSCG